MITLVLYDPDDTSTHPPDRLLCGLILDEHGHLASGCPPRLDEVAIGQFSAGDRCWFGEDNHPLFPTLFFAINPTAKVYWFPFPTVPASEDGSLYWLKYLNETNPTANL